MKKMALNFLIIIGVFLTMALVPSQVYARHDGCKGGQCPAKSWGHDEEAYACPITDKFMSKAYFFLKNQKELALSEDQVRSIKELKLEMKKAYLLQMADHQIFELDLMHKLSEPKIDVATIQGMIDKQGAAMTAAAKETVASYAKLKLVLTPEQLEKAKELHFQKS